METDRTHQPIEELAAPANRRSLLAKTVLGAAAALLPAALVSDAAMAFNDLSGCKKKCNRFSGKCRSGCNRCCRKIFRGSKKRCSFGCGSIKPK